MALYLPLVNLHSRMLFVMSIVEIYRAWKTPSRGLLLAVMLLMATIIAQVIVIATKRVVDQTFLSQNVVIFSLVPDYTMFGDQHYNQVLSSDFIFKSIRPPERRHQLEYCTLPGIINANDKGLS